MRQILKHKEIYKQRAKEEVRRLTPESNFVSKFLIALILLSAFLSYGQVFTYTDKISKKLDLKNICSQALEKEVKKVYVYEFKNAYGKGKIYCTYDDSRLNRMVYLRVKNGEWIAGGQEGVGNKFIWPFLY